MDILVRDSGAHALVTEDGRTLALEYRTVGQSMVSEMRDNLSN